MDLVNINFYFHNFFLLFKDKTFSFLSPFFSIFLFTFFYYLFKFCFSLKELKWGETF